MKHIGRIVSVHGVYGDLTIAHEISAIKVIPTLSVFMIEVWENSFIPFFTEKIKSYNENEFIVKFEEIGSREGAKKFVNLNVYLYDEAGIKMQEAESWTEVIGYTVIDQQGQVIGVIQNVTGNSIQSFVELVYQGKLVLLPLHQDLVINKDNTTKTITLEISDGLLELL